MAKWIKDKPQHVAGYIGESDYTCSACQYRARTIDANGSLFGGYGAEAIGAKWLTDEAPYLTNYCPKCGAEMDNPNMDDPQPDD